MAKKIRFKAFVLIKVKYKKLKKEQALLFCPYGD